MPILRRTAVSAAILIVAAVAGGCSRGEQPPPEKRGAPASTAVSAGSSPADPLAPRLLPAEPTARDDLRLVVAGAGAEGTIKCRWERNGQGVETSNSACLPAGSHAKGDVITVIVEADGREARTAVTIGNSPPEVIAAPFRDPQIHRGVDIEVQPEGRDADGDPVGFRYRWSVNGMEVGGDSPVLAGDRFRRGDRILLDITPFDGEGEGKVFRGKEFTVPNAPPRFISTPSAFQARRYTYEARAEDPDGDVIIYSLEAAPEGMVIDAATGRLSWEIGAGQEGGHRVVIAAQDQEGARAVHEFNVTITLGGKN